MPNAVYVRTGTAVDWKVAGTEVIDLGSSNGAADGVEVGAYHDWGASPQPRRYMMFVDIDGFESGTPTVGEVVDVYITESEDASLWTGPEAPGDTSRGAGNTARLKNLKWVAAAIVRSTTLADNLTVKVEFRSSARYFAPVVHNNTALALKSTGDAHEVRIHPIYDEIQ